MGVYLRLSTLGNAVVLSAVHTAFGCRRYGEDHEEHDRLLTKIDITAQVSVYFVLRTSKYVVCV